MGYKQTENPVSVDKRKKVTWKHTPRAVEKENPRYRVTRQNPDHEAWSCWYSGMGTERQEGDCGVKMGWRR